MQMLAVASVLLLLSATAYGQGMGGMGGNKGPDKAPARKADLPFIRCQVCQAIVKQSVASVKAMRSALKPGKKLEEADIIEGLEKMCDPDLDQGDWISQFDLSEDGDTLRMIDVGMHGECGIACRTVARACDLFTDQLDLSDFSEMLFMKKKRSELVKWACRDTTDACTKGVPALPKDRVPMPQFKPMDEEKIKHQKMMRTMKAAGLKGTMYNRDDMMSQMGNMKGEDDDDEDYPGMGGMGGMG
eukprot:CAMPEP_0119107866 /NCGR_PEP_ID=MMETSP1180-20130426/12000_1 /TAXON_ID=3052 ORGANISM="Chlamydomonas cf sp, Strain CCMP681" /NCGR_SAMPLE_ID=MMETSP1180 /ASSEMBLY_ACC=CAM_ASM_000741 /LENGTH=243 /DNA_ID=CAMNT_0007093413 /DNA_START=60 /DNA_END=787 /DNA_ORIENTATION=+